MTETSNNKTIAQQGHPKDNPVDIVDDNEPDSNADKSETLDESEQSRPDQNHDQEQSKDKQSNPQEAEHQLEVEKKQQSDHQPQQSDHQKASSNNKGATPSHNNNNNNNNHNETDNKDNGNNHKDQLTKAESTEAQSAAIAISSAAETPVSTEFEDDTPEPPLAALEAQPSSTISTSTSAATNTPSKNKTNVATTSASPSPAPAPDTPSPSSKPPSAAAAAAASSPAPAPATKKKLTMEERLAMAVNSDKAKKAKKAKKLKKAKKTALSIDDSASAVSPLRKSLEENNDSASSLGSGSVMVSASSSLPASHSASVDPVRGSIDSDRSVVVIKDVNHDDGDDGDDDASSAVKNEEPEKSGLTGATAEKEADTERQISNDNSDEFATLSKDELVKLLKTTQQKHDSEISDLKNQLKAATTTKTTTTTAAAAAAAASTLSSSSVDQLLKEKDEQIAGLIEEGEKLSMKELKYTTLIKQLRSKESDAQSQISNLEHRLEVRDQQLAEITESHNTLKQHQQSTEPKLKKLGQLEFNYEDLKNRYERAQHELSEYKFKNYEKKLHEMTEKYQDEISKNNSLKKELEQEKIQTSLTKAGATKEIGLLKLEIEDLNNKAKLVKEDYESEVARLENKIEQLRAQNEESRTRGHIGATNDENSGSDDIDKNNSKKRASKADDQLMKQNQTLQAKYESTLQELQQLESTSLAQISNLNDTIAKLKQGEALQVKNFKKLLNEFNNLKEEQQVALESAANVDAEIAELQKQLSLKDDKIGNLQNKYDELLSKHNLTVTALEEKIRTLANSGKPLNDDFIAEDDEGPLAGVNTSNNSNNSNNNAMRNSISSSSSLAIPQMTFRKSSELHVPWGRTPELSASQPFPQSLSSSSSISRSTSSHNIYGRPSISNNSSNFSQNQQLSSLAVPSQQQQQQQLSPSLSQSISFVGGNASPMLNFNANGSSMMTSHANDSSSTLNFTGGGAGNASETASSFNFDSASRFDSISNQNSPFLSNGFNSNNNNSGGGGGGGGPSIQLVGRLSAKVARLETELSTTTEELKRASKERSDTGNEILSLMKQIEDLQRFATENDELTKEVEELKRREQVSLELLGEKSELVEELRNDVADLKDLLRQQVEQMIEMQQSKQ